MLFHISAGEPLAPPPVYAASRAPPHQSYGPGPCGTEPGTAGQSIVCGGMKTEVIRGQIYIPIKENTIYQLNTF